MTGVRVPTWIFAEGWQRRIYGEMICRPNHSDEVTNDFFRTDHGAGGEGAAGGSGIDAVGDEAVVLLVDEIKELEPEGVEGRADEDMGDEVVFPADEGNGGVKQGPHGFAPAGDGGDEVAVLVADDIPDPRKDELGGRLVFRRGADVIERDGAAAGGIGHRNDVGRLGDEFVRSGLEGFPQGFPDAEIVPIGAWGEEFRLDFGSPRHGGDKGDAPRQNPGFAHGECPKRFSDNGRREAGDGEQGGVHGAV